MAVCQQCKNSFTPSKWQRNNGGGKFCTKECHTISQTTRKKRFCDECGKKVKYSSSLCSSCSKKGIRNPNYNGGVTPHLRFLRNSKMYKLWRQLVFERDYWECMKCGHHGGDLHAHHIKPFKDYPELRYELSNGITLCIPCHRSMHHGQPPDRLYQQIKKVINVRTDNSR